MNRKDYIAAWNAKNKKKIAAYKAAHRAANKKKIAAYLVSYRALNKEKCAAWNAAYRAANKKKLAAQRRAAIDHLADWYVRAQLLGNSKLLLASDIPSDLIELKRIQLKIFREIKKSA